MLDWKIIKHKDECTIKDLFQTHTSMSIFKLYTLFHLLISLKHLFTNQGTQIFKTIYICTGGKLSVQDCEKCPERIFSCQRHFDKNKCESTDLEQLFCYLQILEDIHSLLDLYFLNSNNSYSKKCLIEDFQAYDSQQVFQHLVLKC